MKNNPNSLPVVSIRKSINGIIDKYIYYMQNMPVKKDMIFKGSSIKSVGFFKGFKFFSPLHFSFLDLLLIFPPTIFHLLFLSVKLLH